RRAGAEQADDEHRLLRASARVVARAGKESRVAAVADGFQQAQVVGDVVAHGGALGAHAALEFGPGGLVFAELVQLVEQGVAEVDVVLAPRGDARPFVAQAGDARLRARRVLRAQL